MEEGPRRKPFAEEGEWSRDFGHGLDPRPREQVPATALRDPMCGYRNPNLREQAPSGLTKGIQDLALEDHYLSMLRFIRGVYRDINKHLGLYINKYTHQYKYIGFLLRISFDKYMKRQYGSIQEQKILRNIDYMKRYDYEV